MASEIDGQTVQALQTAAVAEIGEKITIRRFVRMEGAVDTYIHLGGSRGVLVQFAEPSDPEAMHDVALQIAAASPICVGREDLPQEFIDRERAVQLATAKEENANSAKPKPEAIIEKMVDGRMQKYYKEVCLEEQQFVKNPDITIKDMLKAKNASKVLAFVRYEKGEGIEKRKDNFAEEIANMTK
jgi:elongation factor Ts